MQANIIKNMTQWSSGEQEVKQKGTEMGGITKWHKETFWSDGYIL